MLQQALGSTELDKLNKFGAFRVSENLYDYNVHCESVRWGLSIQ